MRGDLTDILLVVAALALAAVLGAIIGVFFARKSSRRFDRMAHGGDDAPDSPSLTRPSPSFRQPSQQAPGAARARPVTTLNPERPAGGTSWGAYAVPRQRGRRGLFSTHQPPPPSRPSPAVEDQDDVEAPMTMTVTFHEATERNLSMGPLEAPEQPDQYLRLLPPRTIELPGPPAPAVITGADPIPERESREPSRTSARILPEHPAPGRPEKRARRRIRAEPEQVETYSQLKDKPSLVPAATPIIVPWRSVAAHAAQASRPSEPGSPAASAEGSTATVAQPLATPVVAGAARPETSPPPSPVAHTPPASSARDTLDPILPPNLPSESDWRDVQASLRIRLEPNIHEPAPPFRTLQIVGIGIEDGRRVILASDGPLCATEAIAIDDIADSVDVETLLRIEDPWNWLKAREWRPDLPLSNSPAAPE